MKKDNKSAIVVLREKAEELLQKMSGKPSSSMTEQDSLKLIHELEVHQIELEMQNEELILARYAAKEAAEKYIELYDFAPSGYITLSGENKILQLNHACARMLGKDRSRLINSDFGFFITNDSRGDFRNFLARTFESNSLETCEIALVRSDNLPLWVKIEGVVSENTKECNLTIVDDSVRRQKAIEVLEKSNRQMNLILEAAGEGILGIDLTGNHTFVNPTAVELLGFTSAELMGKSSHILFHHHHPDGSVFMPEDCPIQQTLLNGKPHSGEDYFWRKNGTGFPVGFSSLPIVEENRVTGAVVTFRDITARKQAEDALRESEERNKALLNANPDMMFVLDKNGIFIDYHASNYIALYSPSSVFIGKNISEVMPVDIAGLTHNRLEQLFRSGLMQVFYYQLVNNGELHDFECRLVLCGNSKALSIVRDTTEQKKAEKDLIAAKEQAEESDRLKSAFLANMSHEIRTPMNGILGFAGLLKVPSLSEEEQKEYISIIEKSGVRMLRIINDIIDISKIESGQVEVSVSRTNINEQIEYIYRFFKQEVEDRGILLSFKNSLPLKDAFVFTDREKIFSILTNLLKNAIKFTNTGSIEFGYLLKDKFVEFFVKDTGIGIPLARQQAIFERFVQADLTDKGAYQGAGLGLSISKAYVEMLGGKIRVESEEGKGSVLYFTIPYNAGTDAEIEMPDVKMGKHADHIKKKLKVLIAEDDEISDLLITIAIRRISYEILHAKTGKEVVEICRNNSDIDLILMDIKMPELDGYQTTGLIRQFNKDVVIIAQTAYGLTGDREKALSAGCNDYISKPIDQALMIDIVLNQFRRVE